ncbi:MAG TPA: esterase [Microscillaceae bacterium]|nr:esterase [Microscillaceae bacterium]
MYQYLITIILVVFLTSCGSTSQNHHITRDQDSTTTPDNTTKTEVKSVLKVASGRVERLESFASKYITARNVDVWLPDGYNKEKKYAVLYMHDGQMLYDASTTWNKQEWAVDEVVGKLLQEGAIKPCIVVGIWNGDKTRHADYFPQKPFESLPAKTQDSLMQLKAGTDPLYATKVQSDKYLKFLVEELKPHIDQKYSTYTDAANTLIAGSSMGGLISMYAICEYPQVFSGAACISTHWPGIFSNTNNPIPTAFVNYLKKSLPDPTTHKIYFDHGDATLDALYPPHQKRVDEVMRQKGYTEKNWLTKVFPGENHSENAWKKRLDIPVKFLLQK